MEATVRLLLAQCAQHRVGILAARRGLSRRAEAESCGASADADIPSSGILGRVVAIQGFATRAVERFFADGTEPRRAGWTPVARIARRKLDMLDYSHELGDLKSPPGNRLEPLKGRMAGLHSIRINDQWRIVFRWTAAGPADVDILDYH